MFGNSKIGTPFKGYYITAYGLAVKHGFVGSEEEWLASLNGGNAEFRYNSETKMIEYRHSKTEVWTEMMTLAEFQEGVIKDTLEEMRSARDTAVESKAVAEASAESARRDKEAVSEIKEEASASEANAKVYSESAVAAAETAVSAASLAADAAADANADKNVAEDARESALEAKEAAVLNAQITGSDREAVSEMLTQVQDYAESVSSDKNVVSTMRDDAVEAAQDARAYAESVKTEEAYSKGETDNLVFSRDKVCHLHPVAGSTDYYEHAHHLVGHIYTAQSITMRQNTNTVGNIFELYGVSHFDICVCKHNNPYAYKSYMSDSEEAFADIKWHYRVPKSSTNEYFKLSIKSRDTDGNWVTRVIDGKDIVNGAVEVSKIDEQEDFKLSYKTVTLDSVDYDVFNLTIKCKVAREINCITHDESGFLKIDTFKVASIEGTDGFLSVSDKKLYDGHLENKDNPHSVTAELVGAYTKNEVDTLLSLKADASHTHSITAEQIGAYTKSEVDSKLGDIDTALDSILAIEESLMGGDTV